jgi:4-diphosphocytidyl-2-C-methyl-D-erythritol kinase
VRGLPTSGTGQPSVTARAPAKINIYLGVGPRRHDGFHDLATVFHALHLGDEVVAERDDAGRVSIDVVAAEGATVDIAAVPRDETNLAAQAARALARYAGVECGVRLTIVKRIPVAGGLAGGSADAAAALVACDAVWETGCGRAELATLGARLGSDVPFALHGGTALGSGRGEQLAPVMAPARMSWVVAVADGGLSTPAVYTELDHMRGDAPIDPPAVPAPLLTALRHSDVPAVGEYLANDLQGPALRLRPALADVLDEGRALGAVGGIVSGSGPTVVFLATDDEAASALAADLVDGGSCLDAVATGGAAAGARIVPGALRR